MAQWGSTDQAVTANSSTTTVTTAGAPIGVHSQVKGGGGANAHYGNTSGTRAAADVNLYGNVTPNAFVPRQAVGVFGVSSGEMVNAAASGVTHTGWNLRRQGTGPLVSAAISNTGTDFRTGETAVVTGPTGSVNAALSFIANSSGALTGVTVTNPGAGFNNTSSMSVTFNREKRLIAFVVSGTPLGYSNTDTILVSNGTIEATGTLVTNSTGGFASGDTTVVSEGMFAQSQVAGNLVFAVLAANGAVSAGSGATISGTLQNSQNGSVTLTLGGRAGRVSWETLVAGSITSDGSDDTILPDA